MATQPVRTRRRHSEAFKRQVVEACRAPGASVAGIALAHGVNANLVRRWLHERGIEPPSRCAVPPVVKEPPAQNQAFVPIQIAPSFGSEPTIRIDIRRGNTSLAIAWPVGAAAACAEWLRAWLT